PCPGRRVEHGVPPDGSGPACLSSVPWAGRSAVLRGPGHFSEADQLPEPAGRYVAGAVPQSLARPAQPAAGDGDFEDDDPLDPAAMPLDGVQGRPAGLAGGVQPDDRQLALALRAEQAVLVDAGQVLSERGVA